jgi:CheY-like chemotaxis protein
MLGYRYSALVVDDEDLVRKLTVRPLEGHGFVCTQASDGDEAARLLAKRRFHALVTDLRMPNGNGYNLAID